jgi:hypothetical protein
VIENFCSLRQIMVGATKWGRPKGA